MRKRIDLTGHKFSRLLVLGFSHLVNGIKPYWKCRCDCGKEKTISGTHLKTGGIRSCGCLSRETTIQRNIIHGKYGTFVYRVWGAMISRCTNSNTKEYRNYGGRGIKVCERWLKFENFYEDMGDRKKEMTLERINNNRGYSLDNCVWATWQEQRKNKRSRNLPLSVQIYG